MGKIDTCTKAYISNPRIFADAFNYYFFHGKQVVKPLFTLVIYWGTKEWDAPRSLFEMMDIREEIVDIIRDYVNDYKLHIIIPSENEDFEQFSTELGHCFRYIQSSTEAGKLKKLIDDYSDIYSNLDKISGYLLETVTDTKIPKSAKKGGSGKYV